MPDTVLASLATWAEYIHDDKTMRQWVGGWAGIQRHSPEILKILGQGQAMRPDKGEIFDEWVRCQDLKRKRKRAPTDDGSKDRVDFEKQRAAWLTSQGKKPGQKVAGEAAKPRGRGKKKSRKGRIENVEERTWARLPYLVNCRTYQ